jgi:FMN phosphatase YigB (HAD superfamily)
MWPEAVLHERLIWAGLSKNDFQFCTHAQNMSIGKPHAGYYKNILRQWNLRPEQCLMVGNSVEKDGSCTQLGISFLKWSPGLNPSTSFHPLKQSIEAQL